MKKSSMKNEVTKYFGKYNHGDLAKKENCSWFSTNVKIALATLAAGLAGSNISCLFSFLGLPNLNSFSKKAFKPIESLIGKHIRAK